MKTRQTSIRLSEVTERQIQELTARGFGSFSDVVRTAIDRMSQQEVVMDTRQLAEAIYVEVYGDIDHKVFHRDRVTEITDWLADGEPVTDETIKELAHEWRLEHAGDDVVVAALGARDWCEIELEYGASSLCEIEESIDRMFPHEAGNDDLAARIYAELH